MDLIPLTTIRPDTIHWLWPGRLAQGKLAILDGDPGTGKSQLTLDICARLTTGTPFPDGAPPLPPSPVIILNAEDSIADTVLPRLLRFGADMSKIYTIGSAGLPAFGSFSLPAHIDRLARAVATSHARLVIIDPLMAFLDRSITTASDQSVRSVLTPLAALAQDHACAILMVRHLTKSNRHAIYRGGGSIGILGACRSAWLTGPDPADPSRFILTQTKNNLASPLPALAYAFAPPASDGPPLTWLGPCDIQPNDILRPAHPPRPRARIRRLLEDLLADGPLPYPEIVRRAPDTNHSTLFRAKHELNIHSIRVRQNGAIVSYWLLPGQTLPHHIRTEDIICDPDDILGPEKLPVVGSQFPEETYGVQKQ